MVQVQVARETDKGRNTKGAIEKKKQNDKRDTGKYENITKVGYFKSQMSNASASYGSNKVTRVTKNK